VGAAGGRGRSVIKLSLHRSVMRETVTGWDFFVALGAPPHADMDDMLKNFSGSMMGAAKEEGDGGKEEEEEEVEEEEEEELIEFTGLVTSRKQSVCQHVVNRAKPLELNVPKGQLGCVYPTRPETLNPNLKYPITPKLSARNTPSPTVSYPKGEKKNCFKPKGRDNGGCGLGLGQPRCRGIGSKPLYKGPYKPLYRGPISPYIGASTKY